MVCIFFPALLFLTSTIYSHFSISKGQSHVERNDDVYMLSLGKCQTFVLKHLPILLWTFRTRTYLNRYFILSTSDVFLLHYSDIQSIWCMISLSSSLNLDSPPQKVMSVQYFRLSWSERDCFCRVQVMSLPRASSEIWTHSNHHYSLFIRILISTHVLLQMKIHTFEVPSLEREPCIGAYARKSVKY